MDISQNSPGDSRTSVAFIVSAILHGVLAYVIIVGLWHFHDSMPESKPFVFQMMQGPTIPDKPIGSTQPDPAQPLTSFKLPPQPALPALPVVQTPPAITAPPATSQPQQTQSVKTPPKQTTAPSSPKTVTPVSTTTKSLTYEEYLKQNPKANSSSTSSSSSSTKKPGPPAPPVTISSAANQQELKNFVQAGGKAGAGQGGTAVTADALNRYTDGLVQRLLAVFIPPAASLGMTAEIMLTIAPNGRVVRGVITRGSGNEDFDAAVNAALKRLTFVDPTPSGTQESYKFIFTPSGH